MKARNTPHPDALVIDYYEQTFRKLRLKGRSTGAHYQYLIQLRHFDRFLGRAATLADFDDDTVTAFLADRAEATSPETANKARNHVLALWRFAARKGHVPQFPDVDRLKERKRIPQAWNHAQLAKLVETAYAWNLSPRQSRYCPTGEIPVNLWWTALLCVLYETGIRIGAALQLRVTDVDLETGRVLVPAEFQKQFADQAFTLTPQTRAIIRQFAHVERTLLFPWKLSQVAFYWHFKRLLEAAGLPTGRRCGPHRIRRTTATMAELHIGRGTATGILGHSSAHVTRAYIDTTQLPDIRVGEQLPRALLTGELTQGGHVPLESELLPTPPPGPVPIEHHVSAIILPTVVEMPEANPLLDSDAIALLAEFAETASVKRPTIARYQSRLLFMFSEFGIKRLRDIDATAILDFLGKRKARSLHLYWFDRAAIGSFIGWCVLSKKVYALAAAVEALKPQRKQRAADRAQRKGGDAA